MLWCQALRDWRHAREAEHEELNEEMYKRKEQAQKNRPPQLFEGLEPKLIEAIKFFLGETYDGMRPEGGVSLQPGQVGVGPCPLSHSSPPCATSSLSSPWS